jgi:hypothetical protein
MKVVDHIDTQDRVEKLTEERRDDFFTKLVMGKDVTEEVETSKGIFTVKYPKSKDLLAIGRIMALRRNYKPVESFDPESEMILIFTKVLTHDILIE